MVLLRHGEREDYMAEKARHDGLDLEILDVVVRISAVEKASSKIDQTRQKEL